MKVRTRFAPSPTGFMHIGNLRTALYAYLFAKHHDGTFILRIEDTDQERYVEGAVDLIYSTLAEAKIFHDEGPDKDGGFGPYVQSERKSLYLDYAKELVSKGGAYYCFCAKERLETLADSNGVKKYDKHCLNLSADEVNRRLAAGEPYVIRQNIPLSGVSEYIDLVYGKITVDYADLEDNILIKSDGMPTYNFANVVDDHLMNITHVIRGTEYLSSTPKYNLMYDAFGWERPLYMHLPPIMKDATRKLSKRYGDANFNDFIEKGYLPDAIVNFIALLGWSPKNDVEKMDMNYMIEHFTEDGVNKSSAIFDEVKMRWLNSLYVHELSVDEFLEHAKPYFDKSKIAGKYDYRKLSELLIPRTEIFSDIPDKVNFLEEFGEYDTDGYFHKRMKVDKTNCLTALELVMPALEQLSVFDMASIEGCFESVAESAGIKKGVIMWSVRLAITGVMSSPGGATEMADLLGKAETIRRIEYSKNLILKSL